MEIKFRQEDIHIPKDNPFQNDLLNREESVVTMTQLIGSINRPCVISIDAEWGHGKTTFLNLWYQFLHNEGYSVIRFNAWETDFSNDPFVALTTELTEGIKTKSEQLIDELKESAEKYMKSVLASALRLGTSGIIDINGTQESNTEKRLSEYKEARDAAKKYKKILQKVSEEINNSKGKHPLIVMIDELDRCRPTYAVELLEVAKHLFSVDGIIFILAINCSQLSHSIKALYGHDFDSEGYLKRFIDVDLRLPSPNREAFIKHQFSITELENLIGNVRGYNYWIKFDVLRDILFFFFNSFELDFRQISHTIHRLSLIFRSLGRDKHLFILDTTVALVFRCIDTKLYYKFLNGEVTDLQVSEIIFTQARMQSLRNQDEFGHLFETVLINGYHEISKDINSSSQHWTTPLLDKYKKQCESDPSEDKKIYANKIVNHINNEITQSNEYRISFMQSVRRLELFSPDLMNPEFSSLKKN